MKKSLVALRRVALERGRGAVVSKEEFDAHLEGVLAPHLKDLPDNIRVLAKVRGWPAWKCVVRVGCASHPGTPTPNLPPTCSPRCVVAPPG